MNYVWNQDGIRVGSISMNRWEGMDMWTSGFVFRKLSDYTEILCWEAKATPQGWYIVLTDPIGKKGEFQGSTFNLPLEISAAVRRLA